MEDMGNYGFHISLPYCGDRINCQVILIADLPQVHRDFIIEHGLLSLDTFTAEDLQNNVPSLLEWSPPRKKSFKGILLDN